MSGIEELLVGLEKNEIKAQLDRIEKLLTTDWTLPPDCSADLAKWGVMYTQWQVCQGPNPWTIQISPGQAPGSLRLMLCGPALNPVREYTLRSPL